ncbi:hypothetical protein [Burkholderia ubonensis]|uniref:hypothetical protein n=1 Tax=Burkholderia ubonensis TaxID=101571 RepID=UPI000A9CBA15|nr:hypothetical protein [Burkholderia ubonensis]
MKKIAAVLLALPILASAAECKIKTSNAAICLTPNAAAYAYQAFGFDIARTNIDYNRQMLIDAGCGRAYGKTYRTDSVQAYQISKIATPNGWVRVAQIIVNDRDSGFMAADYLNCK